MEAFNLAAEMKLPVLYILENNGYAMSTPVETANPFVVFEDRVKGFALPYTRVEASDFDNLYNVLDTAVKAVRETREPQFVEVMTHRFCGHSKSDKREYIPKERDAYWHEHDCIKNVAEQLSDADVKEIENKVAEEIERVYQYCVNN